MAASGRSPLYQLPYPLSGDVVDVSGDIQLLATKIDTTLDEIIQDVTGLMVASNTETGITVNYDDTSGKLNFILDNNYVKDVILESAFIHEDHIGVTATYDNVAKQVNLEVTGGGGGGGGTSSTSLTDIWWLGA